MQEEEVRGPIELTEDKKDDDVLDEDGGNEEGNSIIITQFTLPTIILQFID